MKGFLKVALIIAVVAFVVFVPFRLSGNVNGKHFSVSKPAIVKVNQ